MRCYVLRTLPHTRLALQSCATTCASHSVSKEQLRPYSTQLNPCCTADTPHSSQNVPMYSCMFGTDAPAPTNLRRSHLVLQQLILHQHTHTHTQTRHPMFSVRPSHRQNAHTCVTTVLLSAQACSNPAHPPSQAHSPCHTSPQHSAALQQNATAASASSAQTHTRAATQVTDHSVAPAKVLGKPAAALAAAAAVLLLLLLPPAAAAAALPLTLPDVRSKPATALRAIAAVCGAIAAIAAPAWRHVAAAAALLLLALTDVGAEAATPAAAAGGLLPRLPLLLAAVLWSLRVRHNGAGGTHHLYTHTDTPSATHTTSMLSPFDRQAGQG